MRKLILVIALLGFSAMFVNAQTPAPATTTQATPASKKADSKATTKKADTKVTSDKATNTNGVVMKKDGTPDKRYKNAPKGKVKKDGTPDMRHKENQTAAPKK